MAKLKNTHKIFDLANGQAMTVGNNRTITRDSGNEFTCRLHGHPVVKVKVLSPCSGNVVLWLDSCGYLTTTTINAMGDFMRAFGVSGIASRAGGKLSARWFADGWKERQAEEGVEMLKFWANRYPTSEMLTV